MSLYVSTGRLTQVDFGNYWTIHVLFDAANMVEAAKHVESLTNLVAMTGKLTFRGFRIETYSEASLVESIIVNLTTSEVECKPDNTDASDKFHMLKGFAQFLLSSGVVFDAANTPK